MRSPFNSSKKNNMALKLFKWKNVLFSFYDKFPKIKDFQGHFTRVADFNDKKCHLLAESTEFAIAMQKRKTYKHG